MPPTPIILYSDIKGELYSFLVDQACKAYGYFSVVVGSDGHPERLMSALLEELKPNLITSISTRKTPSREIHSAHPPLLKIYSTTPRRIRPILKEVGSLFGWLPPAHPEDLCFYRSDRSLAMVSIAHEHMAWFFDPALVRPYLDGLEWNTMDLGVEAFPNPFRNLPNPSP